MEFSSILLMCIGLGVTWGCAAICIRIAMKNSD